MYHSICANGTLGRWPWALTMSEVLGAPTGRAWPAGSTTTRLRADHIRMILGCGRSVPVPWRSVAVCAVEGIAAVQSAYGLSRNLDGTPSLVSKRPEKYRQVSGRRACAWMAVCKTVGLAYVGSNPTPATIKLAAQTRSSGPGRVLCGSGLDHRSPCRTSRFLTLFGQVRMLLGAGSGLAALVALLSRAVEQWLGSRARSTAQGCGEPSRWAVRWVDLVHRLFQCIPRARRQQPVGGGRDLRAVFLKRVGRRNGRAGLSRDFR